jgi:hypothetical protein
MAFPGTYNFNYYRGDTFEFIIRPKDGSGNEFPLTDYEAEFTIADIRGPEATEQYTGQAVVNTVDNIITCTIDPTTGRSLTPGQLWLYDVEITDGSSIFTLLNGSITVTDDITGAV